MLTLTEWASNLSLNTWHRIRIIYSGNNNNPTTTIYIDGTFSKTISTPVAQGYSSPWTLTIGNFDGDVDEVMISNIDRGPLSSN